MVISSEGASHFQQPARKYDAFGQSEAFETRDANRTPERIVIQ
jgi:hypothetical protein